MANLDVLGTQWAVALSGSILPLRSERINKRAIWLEVVTINAIPMTQQFELNRSVLFSCTFMSRHSTTSFPKKKSSISLYFSPYCNGYLSRFDVESAIQSGVVLNYVPIMQ